VRCPQAAAGGRVSEPCVVSCATSRVIIYPPPVVVTFPGPLISTCPQQAVVGSS
ncbi:KRFJ protein, partial [Oxyruncus cristatus]|nr:KRFJ protein [Oxyruncus cristatus]